MEKSSQSYGTSPAIWDYTVLPAADTDQHVLTLTSARQAGTRFNLLWRDGRLSWPWCWLYT